MFNIAVVSGRDNSKTWIIFYDVIKTQYFVALCKLIWFITKVSVSFKYNS